MADADEYTYEDEEYTDEEVEVSVSEADPAPAAAKKEASPAKREPSPAKKEKAPAAVPKEEKRASVAEEAPKEAAPPTPKESLQTERTDTGAVSPGPGKQYADYVPTISKSAQRKQENYSGGKPSTTHSKEKLMRSEGIVRIQAGTNK